MCGGGGVGGRRTPAKPVWHEDSAIKEASDAYWWLRNCCWPASSEKLNGAEPQARLPGRSTGRCTALLLTLTSPGYLASVMCTLMHLLCSRILRESSLSVASNTQEEGRIPWSASQHPQLPHAEWMTFHPLNVSDQAPPFSQAASHVANLFMLKTFRFTFKQHRISAILDLARGNNLMTFAAHSLSEQLRTVVVMEDCAKPIHSSSLDSLGLSTA